MILHHAPMHHAGMASYTMPRRVPFYAAMWRAHAASFCSLDGSQAAPLMAHVGVLLPPAVRPAQHASLWQRCSWNPLPLPSARMLIFRVLESSVRSNLIHRPSSRPSTPCSPAIRTSVSYLSSPSHLMRGACAVRAAVGAAMVPDKFLLLEDDTKRRSILMDAENEHISCRAWAGCVAAGLLHQISADALLSIAAVYYSVMGSPRRDRDIFSNHTPNVPILHELLRALQASDRSGECS
jgi:hypothetical protein